MVRWLPCVRPVTTAAEHGPPDIAAATLFAIAGAPTIVVTGACGASKMSHGIVVLVGDTNPRKRMRGDRRCRRSWDRDAAIPRRNDGPES